MTNRGAKDDTATAVNRLPLLILAIIGLMAAMWAGLVRLGWSWPALQPTLPLMHGPLMVGGFLGTLISLERAVALGERWAYAGPLLTGAGTVLLVAGVPGWPGPLLMTVGSALLFVIMIKILRIHLALHAVVISLGAAFWLIGNILWLAGQSVPEVVIWWVGFPLLTIAGERLELSRMLRLPVVIRAAFLVIVMLFALGSIASSFQYSLGVRLAGVAMLLMAFWLLRYDVARRRIRAGGQAKFVALSLLSGYLWLAIGGLLAIMFGNETVGPRYDAMLHAILLGFVFSMIFAGTPQPNYPLGVACRLTADTVLNKNSNNTTTFNKPPHKRPGHHGSRSPIMRNVSVMCRAIKCV